MGSIPSTSTKSKRREVVVPGRMMRIQPRTYPAQLARSFLGLALFFSLAFSHGYAQQAPAPSTNSQGTAQNPPTIRAETHAILISVAVRDSNGHPVPNLLTKDFTVTENGHPRDFVMFPADNAPAQPPSPAVARGGFYSNENEPAISAGRKTAILIDAVNTSVEDQAYVREQEIKAIQGASLDSDIALYAMDPDLRVLQDYTRDRDALLRAVRDFRPRASIWLPRPAGTSPSPYSAQNAAIEDGGHPSASRAAMQQGMQQKASFYLQRRIEATTQTLLAIATHMSVASHRNSIIWITAGFPANIDTNAQVLAAIAAVNDANVALYPVDARGLSPSGIDDRVMVLRGIARETGGLAYTLRNDLDQSIQAAIADPDSTYLLGFYLASGDLDGRFHKLHVTVDKPGLQLNYRSGYTASADPNLRREDAEPIESELLAPRDATAIGFEGQVTRRRDSNGNSFRVYLVLDPNTLPNPLPKSGGKVTLTELFAELDARGQVIAKITSDVTFEMPSGKKPAYATTIRAQDGAAELRIVLQDKATKRTGSLRIPLAGISAQ